MKHRAKGGVNLAMKKKNRAVVKTSNVMFDESLLTFYLFAGSSLYAFCITPELHLEHLYFGPRLPAGYDLRFVSANMRSMVFGTLEGSGIYTGANESAAADTFAKETAEKTNATKVANDACAENLLRTKSSYELAEVSGH